MVQEFKLLIESCVMTCLKAHPINNSVIERSLITSKELAMKLGHNGKPVSSSTIYNLRKRGAITPINLGEGKRSGVRYEWPAVIDEIREWNIANSGK